MILMPQIFDVIAIENARYKRNELELYFHVQSNLFSGTTLGKLQKWSHKTGGLLKPGHFEDFRKNIITIPNHYDSNIYVVN